MTRTLHQRRAAGVSRPVTCAGGESSAREPHQPADAGRSPRVVAPAPASSASVQRSPRLPLVAVDVGNSRIKLALFERLDERPLPVPVRTLALAHNEATLDAIVDWLSPLDVDASAWWIGSVARDSSARLIDGLRRKGSRRIMLLSSRDLPLAISLPRPDTTGIDRLLNAVAANRLRDPGRPAIVVSLGTAVTVDLISAEGAFLGGAIMPGIGASARAVHQSTDMLPLVDVRGIAQPPPVLGAATVEALRSGLYWGTVGGVRELIARLSALSIDPPCVLLTGGDAAAVAESLAGTAQLTPHLTLLGIAVAAAE